MQTTTIEILNICFSAGHFTVFSPTERENLHGHNYIVDTELTTAVNDYGIAFDYRIYRDKISALCKSLSQIFLLPGECPFLEITEDAAHTYACFNGERIPFLKRDVKIVPMKNITIEEISRYIVEQLIHDPDCNKYHITGIKVKTYTKPSQSASFTWQRR